MLCLNGIFVILRGAAIAQINRHPPHSGPVDAEIAAFDGFCPRRTLPAPCAAIGGKTIASNENSEYQEKTANILQELQSIFIAFVGWVRDLRPEHWTAIATVAIALFSVALVFVTNRQARLTRESINLAREEFISTHRPKLIVREAYTPLPPPAERVWASVFVTVANVGETAANIVESSIDFDLVVEQRYMRTPQSEGRNDLCVSGLIRPGEAHTFTITSLRQAWDEQALAVYSNPALGLFLVGRIAFTDEIGTRRQVAFCRKYDPPSQRFVRIYKDENEYEYSD